MQYNLCILCAGTMFYIGVLLWDTDMEAVKFIKMWEGGEGERK